MTEYAGQERRKYPRINTRFIVSYRMFDDTDNIDISQSKNLSLGGILLTTNRKFNPGVNLIIEIRLPFEHNPIMLIGKVHESREVTKDLIYDTRIEFLATDEVHRKIISQTVDYYQKKEKP